LKVGDTLRGRVAELLSREELIISFQGDLLRVSNETRLSLNVGDEVTVTVQALQPLRFRLMPERQDQRRRGRLDLSV
jgi:hypothetical protein